jgi:Fe-S cluster biogenesis protein NfuA
MHATHACTCYLSLSLCFLSLSQALSLSGLHSLARLTAHVRTHTHTHAYTRSSPTLHSPRSTQTVTDSVILSAEEEAEEDSEEVAMVKELLETRIRPAVHSDGGDVEFIRMDPDDGVVYLKLLGSCSGCPSSSVTLHRGTQRMLMHYVPEVTGVVGVDDDNVDQISQAQFNKYNQS